jgi:hypothetical protein
MTGPPPKETPAARFKRLRAEQMEAGERYEAEQHTPRGGAMKAEKVAADSAAFEAGQAARKARLADALKKKQTYQSELIRRAFGQDPDE